MPDTKQLRILKKLCTHLELTSGFEDSKIYRGLLVLPADELKDSISILEAPRPLVGQPAAENGVRRLETWTLLVQGWPKDDKKNPSDPAYEMKGAVEQRLSRLIAVDQRSGNPLYPEEYMLGKDAKGQPELSSLTIGQGVVRPPEQQAASRLAYFMIPLVLGLTTDIRNPYL